MRFVQRVSRAFQAASERGGSVRLRLHPPELGSIRLELTVRNGMMTARLEVETATARAMLLDNLPALRERLAEQDIEVQRFDVDLSNQSSGGSPERPGDDPLPHDHPEDNSQHTPAEQDAEAESTAPRRSVTRPGQGDRLDVMI